MSRRILVLVMACFGVGVALYTLNAQQRSHKDEPSASAKALLEVARRGLEQEEQSSPGSRDIYVWLQRVLNAELSLCRNADERIAARERHLKESVRLEETARRLVQDGAISRKGLLEAEYQRCEAQSQLDAERDVEAPARK